MESLDRRVEVGRAVEFTLGQRDVELPYLGRIARLHQVLAAKPTTAVRDTNTWRHPSSRAIGTIFSPAAPPPATSRLSRGSIPWLIVMSLIAPTMWSPATSMIARAASFTSRPRREATFATALAAAPESRRIRPPKK